MIDPPMILSPSGQPARAPSMQACPDCGSGPERRRPSGGFGTPHPVCGECGHEWRDEVWRRKGEA